MSDLKIIDQRLYRSTGAGLFADDMERGQLPGALAIVLTGRCHPAAPHEVHVEEDGEAGPVARVTCRTCGLMVLPLALAERPSRPVPCCGTGWRASYDLIASSLDVVCAGCGAVRRLPVRRRQPGERPSWGEPPASHPTSREESS